MDLSKPILHDIALLSCGRIHLQDRHNARQPRAHGKDRLDVVGVRDLAAPEAKTGEGRGQRWLNLKINIRRKVNRESTSDDPNSRNQFLYLAKGHQANVCAALFLGNLVGIVKVQP